MTDLERFDVLWDFAEERYDRDYWPQGKCVDAGLALERIRNLEAALQEMLEAEWMVSAGWAGSSKREELIKRTEKLLEPPR